MMSSHSIRRIFELDEKIINGLSQVLIDCVEGGASVSFILPMTLKKAKDFWYTVAKEVSANNRILLVAEDSNEEIVGTIQLIINLPENQAHRADIAKMLVHGRARNQGIGLQLLQEAERIAKEHQRHVLVLDTATGSLAERMYQKGGWQICGKIPDYAVWPDGKLCSTTYMYKILSRT